MQTQGTSEGGVASAVFRSTGSAERIEFGATEQIFVKPRLQQTEDYTTGRFG